MKNPFEHVENPIAYIRKVPVEALPDPIRAQLPPQAQVWGGHNDQGEVLALAGDRQLAFVLARQNELVPVSVH